MSSPSLPIDRPRVRKLPFFPASLPDETLLSRVIRYHLLSAESKDEVTFQALFGQTGDKVDFTELAPPCLAVLASLLPGDPLVQLGNILSENTLVPFVVPMVAFSVEELLGAEFGQSNACLICLDEDPALVGARYLHRCHQLPAVTACWKHGTKLIAICPDCAQSFRLPKRLLRAPVTPCSCGWDGNRSTQAIQASRAEHEFAIHARDILDARTRQTSITVLVRFFQTFIEQSDYTLEPSAKINRSLMLELISQQLAEGKTTAEVALATAEVIGSSRNVNWWVSSINRLKSRLGRRQTAQ